jgi:hypothetical protein
MRLIAWRAGRGWSAYHINHIGEPLCGTHKPDKVQASIDRPAEIKDWPRVCAKCRELAIQGATAPIEEPSKVIDLMAALKAALKTKPADRGEAVDGPNGRMAAIGATRAEDTAPIENGQTS